MAGDSWVASGWRLVTRKTKHDWELGTLRPSVHYPLDLSFILWGGKRDWIINHASNMMPPYKSLYCRVQRVSGLVNTSTHTEPYPLYLFIWLFICIPYNISYNNPANISVSPSLVSRYRQLSNTQRELWETLICGCVWQKWGYLGFYYLWLESEGGQN